MITLRHSLFETNSSSTHALVVPKSKILEHDLYPSSWNYDYCFGKQDYRILQSWDQKLAYLYLILYEVRQYSRVVSPNPDLPKFKQKVSDMYSRLCKENNYEIRDDQTLPEHVFKVIDFLNSRNKSKSEKEKLISEVPYEFEDMIRDNNYCEVDHSEYFIVFSDDDKRERKPCHEFLEKCLNDSRYLEKFLFSTDSYITIGGDEYRGYNLKTLGFEYDYEKDEDWKKRVQEYEENYEVYFKGN